ncbi:MAG: single-stranded DNA-binding protein [Thermomonas sp.]|uniref:single-stranded DNA-binding protein n=1 Tax=Thermomonas sp. TaxID=1971895 RepID=UPI0039E28151
MAYWTWCTWQALYRHRYLEFDMATTFFYGKGNIANSPELRRLTSNNTGEEFDVASVRVFFGRYGRDENGDIQQKGGFWREVVIYGQKAIDVAKHLRKGARVLVSGEEQEFYTKDDKERANPIIKIVAEDVALLLTRIEKVVFVQPAQRREQGERQAPQGGDTSHPLDEEIPV